MRCFYAGLLQDAEFSELRDLIRNGGVVAFPTDTSYGLGADPFNPSAVSHIFEIKGRLETKPILLLVDSIGRAKSVTEPPGLFDAVSAEFWPGPLTLIVPAKASLPGIVTANTNTIGVRWPVAPVATKLVETLGTPITATSANRSGRLSTITADEVREQLGDRLDAFIDGGTLPSRTGSTLLDLTSDPPVFLREGPVSFGQLEEFLKGRIRRGAA